MTYSDSQSRSIGGNWSIDDVLTEYYKIMPKREAKILHKGKWMKWETYKKKYMTGESNGKKR